MKKILLILLSISSLFASNIKVNAVLEEYISAWNTHNIHKIDAFYAQDVIWYDLSYDYTTKGKENVSKAITDAFLAYVPDMYWAKNGDVFISEDTVIYEWVYGGTYNGVFEGKTVNNKKFEIKGLSTTRINKEGKIVSHKDYYDLLGFKKQLGLID